MPSAASPRTSGLLALKLILGLTGITQAELGRRLGCSRSWVSQILNGQVEPSPSFVEGVPRILGERLALEADDLHRILFPNLPDVDDGSASPTLRWARSGA